MGVFAAGQKSVGTLRPVTTTAEIEFGRMYAIEGYVHPLSNLSDSLLQRAVNALVAFDSPIDVTFAEIASDGHVTMQGKATHNSPVLLIVTALVLLLPAAGCPAELRAIKAARAWRRRRCLIWCRCWRSPPACFCLSGTADAVA